jgi:NADH oxidase (H2O2-forming)
MKTSVPDIYACGDCVESFDITTGERCMIPLKHNAIEQARVAADHILGRDVSYPGAFLFTRTHFFGIHAATLGRTVLSLSGDTGIDHVDRKADGDYLRVVLRAGKIIGAQAVGGTGEAIGLLLGALWRGEGIEEIRTNRTRTELPGFSYPWVYRKLGVLLGLQNDGD